MPGKKHMLKVTRNRCKICLKLTPKTPGRRYLCHSDVFTINFEHILHVLLVLLIVDLEQVNIGWVVIYTINICTNTFIDILVHC